MEQLEKIIGILDKQAVTLVGVLLKRVEVLEKEGVLTPKLYKALVKELVYEHFRNLKKIVKMHLTVGKVVFKCKKEE